MKKQSISSSIVAKSLFAVNAKKVFENDKVAEKYLDNKRQKNKEPYNLPLVYKALAEKVVVDGVESFTIKGKSKKVILYFHGGAFVAKPLFFHWRFLRHIFEKTDATIIAPLYPLGPTYNYKQTYEKILNIYKLLTVSHRSCDVILMGDSAGANLALVLGLLLKDLKLPQPSKIIGLSPCPDITLSNPKIIDYEKKDPVLAAKGIKKMIDAWVKVGDYSHYLLSPINGNFKDVAEVSIIAGTHEIFYPDVKKFKNILEEQDVKANFYIYSKMMHVFPAYPIPEAKRAIDQIAGIINKD